MINTLIHIGLYKTGSSFLADWFDKNPYIQSKQRSIAGFKSTFDIIKFVRSSDFKNIEYFVIRDAGFTSLSFENFQPDKVIGFNSFRSNALKALKDLFNEPKILLILRNKNDFLRSSYSQYIKEGGFLPPDKMIEQYKDYFTVFFNYDSLINECYTIFGKNNVHVLPFELLEQDATTFIQNIENFLHISHFDYSPKKVNKSLSKSELYWQFKISLTIYNTLRVFNQPGKFLFKKYQKHLQKKSGQGKIPLLTNIFCKLSPDKTLSINTDKASDIEMIFENSKELQTFSKFSNFYE
jgi:hypothetical protein